MFNYNFLKMKKLKLKKQIISSLNDYEKSRVIGQGPETGGTNCCNSAGCNSNPTMCYTACTCETYACTDLDCNGETWTLDDRTICVTDTYVNP